MTARLVAAAVLSALAIFALAAELAAWQGSAKLALSATFQGSCVMRVSSVTPVASAAGVRVGDNVSLPEMDYLSRLAVVMQSGSPVYAAGVGDKIVLAVRHGAGIAKIQAPLVPDSASSLIWALVFKLFFLVIGMFALWRGRDAASLFLGIWTLGLVVPLPVAWFGVWGDSGRLAFSSISALVWTYSPVLLYLIIEALVRGVVARPIIVAARWLMIALQIPEIFEVVVNSIARVTSGCAVLPMRQLNDIAFIATQLVVVAFFVISYVATRGEQRQRVHWVFWSFIISRFGVLTNLLARLLGHPIELYNIEWLTVMVFPAGCAYAVLRHKLMDINFVINRAIVYTLLTTVVVGFFLAVEALFQHFEVGRGISLTVEIAMAVGIGLSMNTVHERVGTAIERLLFQRKHRAEATLTTLAEEVSFIESLPKLLQRTVGDVATALRAHGVGIYERRDGRYGLTCASDGSGLPEVVDADDTAFIRLRKSLAEVDLSDVSSELGADGYAFPLSVRGRMFGALVCGPRDEDEDYSPDERALLRHVAREVAAEVHLIRSRDLADLAQAVASGSESIEELRARARDLTISPE